MIKVLSLLSGIQVSLLFYLYIYILDYLINLEAKVELFKELRKMHDQRTQEKVLFYVLLTF